MLNALDDGRFKSPTLRNVEVAGPYYAHNGSLATLEDVVPHYSRNFNRHPNLDFRVMPLNFTRSPKAALVAFTGTRHVAILQQIDRTGRGHSQDGREHAGQAETIWRTGPLHVGYGDERDTRGRSAMTNPAHLPEPARRLLSLDVVRGITIAFMIMVNNNGGGGSWHFCSTTCSRRFVIRVGPRSRIRSASPPSVSFRCG